MKVLVVSQYFWPETFRVNDIVEYLVSKKYEVDVLTGYPTYPSKDNFKDFKNQKKENYYGANIYRVPIFDRKKGNTFDLFLNYSSFVFSSIVIGYFLLRKKNMTSFLVLQLVQLHPLYLEFFFLIYSRLNR